jgi:hypothetical protein
MGQILLDSESIGYDAAAAARRRPILDEPIA